jgi:hypothetical protein
MHNQYRQKPGRIALDSAISICKCVISIKKFLKLFNNLPLTNPCKTKWMRLSMAINISTTGYSFTNRLSDRNQSDSSLRSGLEIKQAALEKVDNNPSSTTVSLSEASRLAASSAPAETSGTQAKEDVTHPENHLYVDLDQLMIALLSGRKIAGVSAADLQAARSSEANSDLQLKAIEHAALRAGFGLVRKIPQAKTTVDQTTFQARGVIRTAEGK